MPVSVIISNLNGSRFLPHLLETLEAQRNVTVEIIIVDRHSTDASGSILAGHPQVKVVSEPPETGLVSGYHRGFLASSHEHLFFINEDMWFDLDCLQRLEEKIDLEKRIGAADPWQWTYDGAQWIHGATRFRQVRWAINGVHPYRAYDFTVDLPDGSLVPFPCAGALMIHRQVYVEAGGWDTSIFLDNEDIDLFLRTWQRGWHCVSVPSAKVYHAVGGANAPASQSPGKKPSTMRRRRYISNRIGKMIVIWKYFSLPAALWMGIAHWFVTFSNNALKLRFRTVVWDVKVLANCLGRLPAVIAFRALNRSFNREHPGEDFFTQPQFSHPGSGK